MKHNNDGVKQSLNLLLDARLRASLWSSVATVFVADLVIILVEWKRHELVLWAHLILLPITMATVAIGYLSAKREPISELVREHSAPSAPFMLSKTIELFQELETDATKEPSRSRRARRADAVVEAFLAKIRPLKQVQVLAQDVADAIYKELGVEIRSRAVWAVCGRKDPQTADLLYEACKKAFEARNHIERVFFPPDSAADAKDILSAIAKHLEVQMTVRVFAKRHDAAAALYGLHLPRGFGMTWIGHCLRSANNNAATREPVAITDVPASVFVHWGGLKRDTHNGILLQGNMDWADHLWELFEAIRGSTVIANSDNNGNVVPMTIDEFKKKYPHYTGPGP